MASPGRELGHRRATRNDVAAMAGVSAATVSFVLNPESGQKISADVRKRVLTAVARLGYRPNRTAQGLRTGRTATIGFVLLDERFALAASVITGAHHAAMAHDRLLLMETAGRSAAATQEAILDLLDHRVEALIIAAEGTRRVALPEELLTVPTVLVDCFTSRRSLPSVLPDEATGGRDATRVLLDAGHRSIAYLTGLSGAWATRARLRGFRQALQEAGVPLGCQTVRAGNYQIDSGYELTRQVLAKASRPSAFLCGNDRMALGCLLALLERGLRVPDDVSVMGYDDHADLAAQLYPPLTTVRLPYEAMGRWAAERVCAPSGAPLPPRTLLPCRVVVRESVGPASFAQMSRTGNGIATGVGRP